MRHLLMVAPAFPPHPSASGHRWRFVAKYAAPNGWSCDVLTVKEHHHAEPLDEGLRRLVPPEPRLFTTEAVPQGIGRRFGIGDIALRAFIPMRRMLERLLVTRRPDVIYIPGPPYYQFLLGPYAWDKYGVPYVVDYTDPWVFALTPEQDKPTHKSYWSRRLALLLEPRVVRKAAHVFAVSDGTNEGIRSRYPDVPAERFSAVPFGFEPDDFAMLRSHPPSNPFWAPGDGGLHLVYVGAMLPHGYETLRALFRAVLLVRDRQPALGSRLRLHFFGTTYDPGATEPLVLPTAREIGIADVVTEHPQRIPYLQAMGLLTSADVVLALGSSESHYTASKIFPILLSGRPVFAAYHEKSSVCDVVMRSGIGELVTYDDEARAETRVLEFAAALERALAAASAPPRQARLDGIEKFSARATTGHIYEVMERIAARHRPAHVLETSYA